MYKIGLDVGSTTIKCVVLDEADKLLYSFYERHYSHVVEKSREILQRLTAEYVPDGRALLAVSGSAGMGMAQFAGIPFVQEVYATRVAVNRLSPGTDCVIELGGEDAKILFLTNGMEVRMNGTCAGGTGAFIDQMATLLRSTPEEMNQLARGAERTYAIAARCGVFAKSDVQPLINQGVRTSDISASIYQAVVNQTIAGLAQGRPIEGNVLYLGGPLTFSDVLRSRFDKTLGVSGVCPENSLYYVALGAAFYAEQALPLAEVQKKLADDAVRASYASLPALFENEAEYEAFRARHDRAKVPLVPFDETAGPVHIGIDSGSTTIKMVAIDAQGRLLHSFYAPNDGNPLPILQKELAALYAAHPDMRVASVTTTGYGEELVKSAFSCDYNVVETVAHYRAARHFLPEVDFIIDIGGQDMKCFKVEDGAISDIFLNEACSSGCGSFLQTFAKALGYSAEEFAKIGLFAKDPVDLGSRCTVFMNSSVKQAQKDGADISAISAGLSISVVKNALYKVIRASGPEQLGRNIVVQGGTFYNDAVLRAFEKEMGVDVIRPNIAGLMGAFGAALYGLAKSAPDAKSSLISREEIENFSQQTRTATCGLCGNNCQLTINTFANGARYISGNRCERPTAGKAADDSLDLYAYKLNSLLAYANDPGEAKLGTIGIPFCLNLYELLPFWHRLFRELGFAVKVSPAGSQELYHMGQHSIPSDTACFPAKLSHGHIAWLCREGVDAIFYPCMSYNFDEALGDNHYNCPIVAYYPEVLRGNCRELAGVRFIDEYLGLDRREDFTKKFPKILQKYFPAVQEADVRRAIDAAYSEYARHMADVRSRGMQILEEARAQKKHIIVLAGRPYHVDPEVNHGIDKLIVRQNAAVVTEDAISPLTAKFATNVLNQWTYHSRLYAAAKYCTTVPDVDLVQLVSFGCGLDAITTDETREILEGGGKLYTQIKIDEITNLGTVNIRIRSLFAALEEKGIL